MEALRGNNALLFGQFREARVVVWILLAGALFLMGKRVVRREPTHATPDASIDSSSAE